MERFRGDKMKKLFFIGLVLFLLPVCYALETVRLDVETVFTDPYPVEPGQSLTLSLQISNEGSVEIKNAKVQLDAKTPFVLLESSEKQIDLIEIGKSRIIEYKLSVDSSAVSAVYEIPVRITYGTYTLNKNIQVRVQGTPKFKLLSMDSDAIKPGDQAGFSVKIQNIGTGKARRTTATFSSTSAYIKPIFLGGNVYIGDFNAGETKEIEFNVLSSYDAEYGVYTGTVNISFEDESGNTMAEKFDVGMLISGEPKLQIVKIQIDQKTRELSVEMSNIGTAETRAINAKLTVDDKIVDTDYVTSVNIDKRTTFKFIIPSSTSGKLELSYEGPDNKEYSQTEELAWQVPFVFPTWIVVVVVLVMGYVVVKKKLWKKIF